MFRDFPCGLQQRLYFYIQLYIYIRTCKNNMVQHGAANAYTFKTLTVTLAVVPPCRG